MLTLPVLEVGLSDQILLLRSRLLIIVTLKIIFVGIVLFQSENWSILVYVIISSL